MTVNPREALPAVGGRQTQALIDAAARAVVVRKGYGTAPLFDDAARITALGNAFHRTIDHEETAPT